MSQFLGYIYSLIRKIRKKVLAMCYSLSKMYRGGRSEVWNPCQDLFCEYQSGSHAILILNTDFNLPPGFLLNLWKQAKVRITVDGGTGRWLSWLKSHHLDYEGVSPPDLITGDMDSLSKEILDFFAKNQVTKVVKTPDQNHTDFTKALIELNNTCIAQNLQLESVFVIADTCGRFDQIIANINTLCKAPKIVKKLKVYQVASNSITWLLQDGEHTIHIPQELRKSNEWCALIPIKSPTYATTTGLKWNLNQSKLEFGGMVSTSNTYDGVSPTVTVSNDSTLIWSMGIETLLV
ncbi:thiamin pyrophosphokinase 1 isoform X1 [Tribolium castaneum]|nr:PREDICTED: thiamin pyrophosphokinase 1 isoform X1 [Tribolium castaneum]|eukprot:XP_015840762.1 PREDICTED: thiamin pyrophosphokinase 1 isoform X1 [Tribolium castaneum]